MRNAVLGTTMALLLGWAASTAYADTPAPRTVSVNGQGEVSVQPDRAQLALSAEALAADPKAAEAQVNAIVRAYLAEARALGAQEPDVSTAGISLAPEYRWDPKQNRQLLNGYRARREIAVVVRRLDQLGDYVLRATKVGITQINPPQLQASRSDEYKRQALIAAARDARGKAQLLAETLGMKLGAVRSLRVDDASAAPVPMVKAFALRAEAAADGGGNEQLGFVSGEIKYNATATADFDLLEP